MLPFTMPACCILSYVSPITRGPYTLIALTGNNNFDTRYATSES